jgi:hypothetical protein
VECSWDTAYVAKAQHARHGGRLDALVPHKSDAVGQFIEDRVLHAREDAEENAQAERLADPDAYTTEPRDSG